MTLRLLAPAGPVESGRVATVRARFRSGSESLAARWEWDDGNVDHADVASGDARTGRSHRYERPGVYRVRVRAESHHEQAQVRYVTVRAGGQVAASGWIRDAARGAPVPFGFLITPGTESGEDAIVLRCALGPDEMRATELTWLFVADPGSLHFGGSASIGTSPAMHPFRVDVRSVAGGRRTAQQLTMSVYATGAVPGHDSPVHRLSGPIRPGRIDLGPYAQGETPA